MSHKTEYKTFSNTNLNELEIQVNDFMKTLHKNEHHEAVKVQDITTFTIKDNFIAAITYSYIKKKRIESVEENDA
ncbi:MAG: hypothetical protein WC756_12825 [Taibaiella sp.]|jgi:hypothetical protein